MAVVDPTSTIQEQKKLLTENQESIPRRGKLKKCMIIMAGQIGGGGGVKGKEQKEGYGL